LELSAWPDSYLNAETTTDEKIHDVLADLKQKDIELSALGYYPNYLDPNKEEAEKAQKYLIRVMDLATKMNVKVVCTFVGRDPAKSVHENLPEFQRVFSMLCNEAEKRNIKLAIENCPMMDRFHLRGENIAFSPEIWDEMYKLVPTKTLGIELDPSHMVWQQIDYVQAVYDFGDRIYHIHAKDMEINRRVLSRTGILGACFGDYYGLGHGWWRARTPGWGEVDWPKFITALLEVNYTGNMDIEHEDDVFALANALGEVDSESGIVDTYGRETKGLQLGYNTLSKLIPPEN